MTLKPVIIIDSREQLPFEFSDLVEVQRGTLPLGDYSLAGLTDQVAVERKSLPDLLASITRERERFIRELKSLRRYQFACIVIESTWAEIESGLYMQKVSPASVIGSLMSFAIKYNVCPIMAGDHATGAILTEKLLTLYHGKIVKDYRILAGAPKGDLVK